MPRPTMPRRFVLPIESVRPVVRIAHRVKSAAVIAERVILDHEIVLMTSGRWTWSAGDESRRLKAGDLLVIPPFLSHRFSAADDASEHIAVHFDPSPDVPGAASGRPYHVAFSHGRSLPRVTAVSRGGTTWAMLERIAERFARPDPAAVLEANCLTGAVVARLLDRSDADPRAAHRVKLSALLAYIDANLHTPLAAEDLAVVAGLSPSRLRAVFQELMGTSPKQFVQHRRIALARRLLADQSVTIKAVATKTGFADAFHFSKAFRKIDGLSPSVYRRQAVSG